MNTEKQKKAKIKKKKEKKITMILKKKLMNNAAFWKETWKMWKNIEILNLPQQ